MKTTRRSKLDERIVETVGRFLRQNKLPQDPFARSVGIDGAQFRRLMNGEARWNTWHLEVVAQGMGVSPEELINPACRNPAPMPTLKIDHLDRFRKFKEDAPLLEHHYVAIRLLKDMVAAGVPTEINEGQVGGWALIYDSREWLPHDPGNYTCAHVAGDSMLPVLAPGDIVAIDHVEKNPETLNGKMVAFQDNGGVTVKWLRYYPEKQLVVGDPENPARIDTRVVLVGDEINGGIVGKVTWWWAKR